jgi:hypothetical protein
MQVESLLLIPKTVPKSTRLCSTFQSVVFGFAIRLGDVTGTAEGNSSLRACLVLGSCECPNYLHWMCDWFTGQWAPGIARKLVWGPMRLSQTSESDATVSMSSAEFTRAAYNWNMDTGHSA